MTTFQPTLLQCPACKQKSYCYQLSSFTVYRSTIYSDSKTITEPWHADDEAIMSCPACSQPFWVDDARIETEDPYALYDELPKALDRFDLPFNPEENMQEMLIDYHKKLLNQGLAYTDEKKVYLRIRLWWAINDLVRYHTPFWRLLKGMVHFRRVWRQIRNQHHQRSVFRSHKALFNDNIAQLILLLNPKDEDENILLAEMHREMGNFTKASGILHKLDGVEYRPIRKLRRAILFRKKRVFKL